MIPAFGFDNRGKRPQAYCSSSSKNNCGSSGSWRSSRKGLYADAVAADEDLAKQEAEAAEVGFCRPLVKAREMQDRSSKAVANSQTPVFSSMERLHGSSMPSGLTLVDWDRIYSLPAVWDDALYIQTSRTMGQSKKHTALHRTSIRSAENASISQV
ncbi:hypothetical protein PV11_09635 [Exophiala sideris]|uniref:Uncharacterized protein n=1 Tax=Exophiala sideris TaxID=1016849 RepID=A0A0D1Y4U6_9EURO|nr:hypothetical protein PV11_09635 [Exophiala sideris]